MYVYKITNKINNKIYIGKTKFPINKTIDYYGSGIQIINAIKKYGKENFKKEIIQECSSIEELNEQEKQWISKLNSNQSEIGYNITMGGDGGDTISKHPERERICRKYSERNIKYWTDDNKRKRSKQYEGKNNPFSEKHHTVESIHKISIKKKGTHNSIKANNKISETLKRKYESGEIVKIVSEETCKKISELHIGMKHTQITKDKLHTLCTGAGNPSAKTWMFINISGEQIIVKGEFEKFCVDNDLSYSSMRKIINKNNKYHKSWTVKKLTNK